jgi:hypothetical protein
LVNAQFAAPSRGSQQRQRSGRSIEASRRRYPQSIASARNDSFVIAHENRAIGILKARRRHNLYGTRRQVR